MVFLCETQLPPSIPWALLPQPDQKLAFTGNKTAKNKRSEFSRDFWGFLVFSADNTDLMISGSKGHV